MNTLTALMLRKVRGFRVVDLAAAACLALIVLVVYGSKAGAGAEASRISDTTRQIAQEQQQVELLRAERAYLARPQRLRQLSEQYLGMGPVKAGHEATPEKLAELDHATPAPVASPTPAPAPVEAAR
jgi:hypothetical protein